MKGRLAVDTNEWELIRRQFDALTHDESAESVEDIFDAQFRRRFVELITEIAKPERIIRSIDRHQD